MVEVVAKRRGYFGGVIREPGDTFDIPEGTKLGSWMTARKAGVVAVVAAASTVAKASTSAPAGVVVPADWQNLKAPERKALAVKISGAPVANANEATKIIAAYVEATKPAPFSDAPAPETAQGTGNGVVEALGGPAPDWIAHDVGKPQAVAD